MHPTISIVIPVYNRSSYLPTAIESVLKQTRRDFELIIWDDGSTDNSLDIARNYAKIDQRITVLGAIHQGQTPALRGAFSITTGTYLGWIDSDDILAPTALAETATQLETNPQTGLVYTDYLVINENNQILGKGHRCQTPYSPDKLLVDFMTFHFRLMRKEAFERAGGIDLESGLAQDYDLCLRLSETTQFYHLQRPLYYHRQHSGCISSIKRIELIYSSQQAISRALQRRGMASSYEIDVEIIGRYQLKRKAANVKQNKTSKTILFYPHLPYPGTVIYKICHQLGYSLINDPTQKFDLAFKWQDSTFSFPDRILQNLATHTQVLNINCNDISKNYVDAIFQEIFGYSSLIDPLIFRGKIVRKSNMNATHDGQVIDSPIEVIEKDYIYQKLINNQVNENFVEDIRVTILKNEIPYLSLKYRPIKNRFREKSDAKIAEVTEIFSQEEIDKIISFAQRIGLDYGDLDILRDKQDNKIYIIDVNNTPWGLNSDHMLQNLEKIALTKLSESFKRIFIDFKTNHSA